MFDLSSLFGKATSFLGEVNPAELIEKMDASGLSDTGLDTASLADGSAFGMLTDILGQNRP